MQDAPEPGIETQMFDERQAEMRELVGKCVQLAGFPLAIVTRAYSPEVVNVVTLGSRLIRLTHLQVWTIVERPPYVCSVFYRHESGVQFLSLVTKVNEADQIDLLVLSDGYVDLGLGEGVPVIRERVTRGQGHLCWLAELDS